MKTLFTGFVALFISSQALAFLTASPSWVDFGTQNVNSYTQQAVFVFNQDEDSTNVFESDNCSFDGFQVNNFCFGVIPANGSCNMNITFEPTSAGYKSCTITLSSSDGGIASVSVSGQAN